MKNEFKNISLNTCVANFPEISNYNNKVISDEFDTIRNSDDKIVLDVSANEVNCINSKVVNLTVTELNIIDKTGSGVSLNQYITKVIENSPQITEVKSKSTVLEQAYYNNVNSETPVVYGMSDDIPEYDMSSFFTSARKGIMKDLTTDDLYHVKLYRVLDGLKIPLFVGTCVIENKFRLILYHDHIMITPNKKKVDRIFVAVVNGPDKNSVIQYAGAESLSLN